MTSGSNSGNMAFGESDSDFIAHPPSMPWNAQMARSLNAERWSSFRNTLPSRGEFGPLRAPFLTRGFIPFHFGGLTKSLLCALGATWSFLAQPAYAKDPVSVTECRVHYKSVVQGGRPMAAYGATLRVRNDTTLRIMAFVQISGLAANGAVSDTLKTVGVRPIAPHSEGPPFATTYHWLIETPDDGTPTHGFTCSIQSVREDNDPLL